MFVFSDSVVPRVPLLSPHLCEVVPHNIPCIGHPMHCGGIHRSSGLSQSECSRGDPKFLLAPQLDGSRHDGALRDSGTESGMHW